MRLPGQADDEHGAGSLGRGKPMRAARYYGPGDIRVEDVPEPVVAPDEVGVDVAWCGICGTDVHEFVEGPIFCPLPEVAHPVSGESAPVTMGHEFSGVVYACGDDVDDLHVGQHVVVEPYIVRDDVDTSAANPVYHLSKDVTFIGLGGRGGGLSEKVAVKRRWVHPVDASVPLDQAALIEPLSVAYHAYQRSQARPGDLAVVAGAGPIGLLTAAVLHAEGLTVVVSETNTLRRETALRTGVADHVLDPRSTDVAAAVRSLSPAGDGAAVAFECSSAQSAMDTVVDALRPRGVLVVVSIWSGRASFEMQQLVLKELDVRGTIAYAHSHPDTIALVERGGIDLAPFITGRIGLDDLLSEGFDTLLHRSETAVKIVVSPTR